MVLFVAAPVWLEVEVELNPTTKSTLATSYKDMATKFKSQSMVKLI